MRCFFEVYLKCIILVVVIPSSYNLELNRTLTVFSHEV
jgi:hypothetical protein